MDNIHINIDHILEGWQHASHAGESSVGRICPWGGHYICIIHDDVPEGEREEVAKYIAEAPGKIHLLEQLVREYDVFYRTGEGHGALCDARRAYEEIYGDKTNTQGD